MIVRLAHRVHRQSVSAVQQTVTRRGHTTPLQPHWIGCRAATAYKREKRKRRKKKNKRTETRSAKEKRKRERERRRTVLLWGAVIRPCCEPPVHHFGRLAALLCHLQLGLGAAREVGRRNALNPDPLKRQFVALRRELGRTSELQARISTRKQHPTNIRTS